MELTPPPRGDAVVAAGGEAKRARKRSRYLSPPYTDTAVVQVDVDADKEPPLDLYVSTAEVLSALRAAALLSPDPNPNAGQAFRFLALYRKRNTSAHLLLHSATGVDHKRHLPKLSSTASARVSVPAPAMATPTSRFNKKKQKQKQNPPAAVNVIRKDNNAAALDEAGHKRVSQSSDSAPAKRRRNNKKMMHRIEQEHFKNPVALVLDLAQGTASPSSHDLLSTFRRFGSVIHFETAVVEDHHSARLVFATRTEAEAAYSYAETAGAFAAPRLQDLPPITLNVPPPVPKIPLNDVRRNLEKMILSLTQRSSSSFKAGLPQGEKSTMGNLVGEMKGLLAKVNKMLQEGASSSTVQHL